MQIRHLISLLLMLPLLCALAPARAATTFTFSGGKIDNCDLTGKVYSCSKLPMVEWNDSMVIGKNYTVNVSGDVVFGYNHGLTMGDRSALNATGNLDIGGIASSLLLVSGASFGAGRQFSMGALPQTIVADIAAATVQLGTGSQSKVTGTITAAGAIAIGSNVTIAGPVKGSTITTNSPVSITGDVTASSALFLASHSSVKGNIVAPTVSTDSPVTINGDVTASRAFTLASGSTMTGNIKSDVVELLAASVTVNGNIEATTSLHLGSSDTVNGNVVTGELTLDASSSAIVGNATVDHATLEWAARVTSTITCRNGSTPGKCDCVTNNSGYDVRNVKTSGNGPYCEGGAVQAPHHYLIGHPASASVCAPASVAVTACANAACTGTYAGGATVYLQPGKQRVDIGKSGTVTVAAQMPPNSPAILGLVNASGAALAASCNVSGSASASNCQVQVSDAALELKINDKNAFYAGSEVDLNVTALQYSGAAAACVPLFKGVQRNVAFSFGYDNPASGTLPLQLGGQALKAGASLNLALDFDQAGKATTRLSYPDAGRVKIGARAADPESSAAGSLLAIAAPASFKVELSDLPTPRKAGSPFTVKVTALNAAKVTTPNFGRETQPATVKLASRMCRPGAGADGFDPRPAPSSIDAGVQIFAPQPADGNTPLPRMREVGSIDIEASLAAGSYFGSGLAPTGISNVGDATETACTGASGDFIPASFRIEEKGTRPVAVKGQPKPLSQYYSDERAIALTVTALNLLDETTKNYAGKYARDANLSGVAFDAADKELKDYGRFVLTRPPCESGYSGVAVICATDYLKGVAALPAKLMPGYVFNTNPSAPARVRLDVTDTRDKVTSSVAVEPSILVRSGRVRIASNYTRSGKELALPVSIEYWNGQSWVRNTDETTFTFPAAAFAKSTRTPGDKLNDTTLGNDVQIVKGYGELKLMPPAGVAGVLYVALNLGSTTADNTCLNPKKPVAGAARPFLRAAEAGCPGDPRDPWARATFGIYEAETRRVIHVREVFR